MKYRIIYALRLRLKLSKAEITKDNSTLKDKKKLLLIELVFDGFFSFISILTGKFSTLCSLLVNHFNFTIFHIGVLTALCFAGVNGVLVCSLRA